MNKIGVTIDMRDDRLQFPDSKTHINASSISLPVIKKIAIEQKSLIFTQILKRSISSVITRLSEKSSSFSKIVKPSNSVNFASSFGSMNIAMIEGSKYLTRLNIIVVFNKLRMHSKSEDLTTFITSFDFYKYHVMPFELTNGPTFYQHYMNDVLFDYLHQFCQVYLDDIIIYSKTLKKHKKHVRLVLHRLREVDLQMNINKCKFHVQEISFLELLLFIEGLKMNSRKVQAVVE